MRKENYENKKLGRNQYQVIEGKDSVSKKTKTEDAKKKLMKTVIKVSGKHNTDRIRIFTWWL